MYNVKDIAKDLLTNKTVAAIIGYKMHGDKRTKPVLVTTPEGTEGLVFNNHCLNNLSVYLTKKEIRKLGKIGIFAKGCDIRSIIALIQENQLKREDVYIIGVNCNGVTKDFDIEFKPENLAMKCFVCKVREPKYYDTLIGSLEQTIPAPDMSKPDRVKQIEAMSAEERWDLFQSEFDKCIKCYACRQACSMCYCEQCIADKSVPRWIESSASQRGNFAWNLIRAFHLSGRCTGCNECERACPMDIPLSLLNKKMGMTAMEEFGYMSGMDLDSPTLIGSFDLKDNEDFIE